MGNCLSEPDSILVLRLKAAVMLIASVPFTGEAGDLLTLSRFAFQNCRSVTVALSVLVRLPVDLFTGRGIDFSIGGTTAIFLSQCFSSSALPSRCAGSST